MGVKVTYAPGISGICVCGEKLSKPTYCAFTFKCYMKCKSCGRMFNKIYD